MTRLAAAALALVSLVAFGSAFGITRHRQREAARARVLALRQAPDSVQLAAQGIAPGKELMVFVLVSARCGFCQERNTKRAIASISKLLRERHAGRFAAIRVIGVAADRTPGEGLDYLRSVGLDAFDEVAAGSSWFNEHLVRLVWRDGHATAMVPQVVLLTRDRDAQLEPFHVRYSADEVVDVIRGRAEVLNWTNAGVPLRQPGSGGRGEATATAPPSRQSHQSTRR